VEEGRRKEIEDPEVRKRRQAKGRQLAERKALARRANRNGSENRNRAQKVLLHRRVVVRIVHRNHHQTIRKRMAALVRLREIAERRGKGVMQPQRRSVSKKRRNGNAEKKRRLRGLQRKKSASASKNGNGSSARSMTA
jgi:hypothetical protein